MPKKKDVPGQKSFIVSCQVPFEVRERLRTLAQRAAISNPEVLEQLIWAYLPALEQHWESGAPVPPRPWRDLPMPKHPPVPKPTTKETDETSGLATYIASGSFPDAPEPVDPPAQEPAEALPASDGGSTRVVRRRKG